MICTHIWWCSPQHSDIIPLILACMWVLGLNFPNLCTKFMFNCCFCRSCVQRSCGNPSTAGVTNDHCNFMKTDWVAENYNFMFLHRCASLQPVPHKSRNAEIKYYKICQQLYIFLDSKCLSSFWPNILIVNVYMDFWTKYVTPSFINTDWVTQKL